MLSVRTALSEELLQGSQRKEPSILQTVFIERNAKSFGGLHRDFTGVCQTGRNVLRKGSTGLDVQEFLGHSAVSTTMNIYARAHKNLPLTIPSS